jgi:hypothetical protein
MIVPAMKRDAPRHARRRSFQTLEATVTRTQLRTLALSLLTAHVGAFSVLGMVGCAASDAGSSTELAAAGADGADTEADLESLGQSFVGGSSSLSIQSASALSPSLAAGGLKAEGIVSNPAGGFYQPAGCLVEDSDTIARTATYTFTDCTGPFGLVQLNGVVSVSWSVSSADTLNLKLSSENFKVNAATITSWNASAVITSSGDGRDMTWSASLAGTTGSGRAFTRTNDKDIKWTVGQSCIDIGGSSQGTISGLDLETTITSYSRCEGSCPAAGSEINVKDVTNGDSVDVKYLGGDRAQFTSIKGTETDLTLFCGL